MIVRLCDRCKVVYDDPSSWRQTITPAYKVYDTVNHIVELCPSCQREFEKRFENWLNKSEEK